MSNLITQQDPTEIARRRFAETLMQQGLAGGQNDAGALGGLAKMVQAMTGAYMTKQENDKSDDKMQRFTDALTKASDIMSDPSKSQLNVDTMNGTPREAQTAFPSGMGASAADVVSGAASTSDMKPAQDAFPAGYADPLAADKRQKLAQATIMNDPDVAKMTGMQRLGQIFASPTHEIVPEGAMDIVRDSQGREIGRTVNPKNDSSSLEKSLASAGLVPGTQAYKDAVLANLTKSNSVVNMPPLPKAYDEAMGKADAEAYNSLNAAGNQAPAAIGKFQRLGSLLQGVQTGALKPTTTQIKAAAKSAGFDLESWGITDDLAPAQAVDAASKEMALQLRNPSGGAGMPGAMSDSDRNYLESMVAGLGKDPQANTSIIDAAVKMKQRDADVAKLARQYTKANGGRFDQAGFSDDLAKWSKQNPLFPQAPAAPPGAAQPGAPAAAGGGQMTIPPNAPFIVGPQGQKKYLVNGQWQ